MYSYTYAHNYTHMHACILLLLLLFGGKGRRRQQLLTEPTVTNLNKLQFTQLQMICELVRKHS